MTRWLSIFVFFFSFTHCKGDKVTDAAAVAYAEDIKKICNAKELSGAANSADPSESAVRMADYLKTELKTDKAMKLMQSMATLAPTRRATKLREEGKKAGLKSCALANES